MSKSVLKVLIILGVLAYAISPVDALPGPIDDLIVIILGYVINKRITAKNGKGVIDADPF